MSVSLKQYLKDVHARGIRILEHPDYGGVHSWLHMAGSYHSKGRAGDLNYGPAGAPPEEKAMLLWAARLAEAGGLNTIYAPYRTHPNPKTNANHRYHLHVDDSPVSSRGLKPRAGHVGDALYRKILAEKPLPPKGKTRKPQRLKTLRKGDKGGRVKDLQRVLKHTGDHKGAIDGSFGPQTDYSDKRFQKRTGLKADGIVGPKTRYRLVQGLKKGHVNVRVRLLKTILGLSAKGDNGKTIGDVTETRMKQVQRWLGVAPDGVWGPKTVKALIAKG